MKLNKLFAAVSATVAALALTVSPVKAQANNIDAVMNFSTDTVFVDMGGNSPADKVFGGELSALDLSFAIGYMATLRNCATPNTFAYRHGFQRVVVQGAGGHVGYQDRTLSCITAAELVGTYGYQKNRYRLMQEDMGNTWVNRAIPVLNLDTPAKVRTFRAFRQSITLN